MSMSVLFIVFVLIPSLLFLTEVLVLIFNKRIRINLINHIIAEPIENLARDMFILFVLTIGTVIVIPIVMIYLIIVGTIKLFNFAAIKLKDYLKTTNRKIEIDAVEFNMNLLSNRLMGTLNLNPDLCNSLTDEEVIKVIDSVKKKYSLRFLD